MSETPAPPALSRRGLVKTTAALAAVGGAALLPAAPAAAAGPAPQRPDTPAGAEPGSATAAPASFTVHVRDAATGELDIYHGTSHTPVRDRALAARLARLTA